MKLRGGHPAISDDDERRAAEGLRSLINRHDAPTPPADAYWSNLIIRANQRIDDATSGKALSISWAARVAIPGVIAILSFFIGLQYYYVQDKPQSDGSLVAVVLSAPDEAVDSLATHSLSPVELAGIHADLLEPTSEQLAEYFLTTAGTHTVLEDFTEDQVNDVLAKLGSNERNI